MDMELLLQQIFEVCIIPLLGVLTAYVITYIQTAKEQLKKKTDNDLLNKYLSTLFYMYFYAKIR